MKCGKVCKSPCKICHTPVTKKNGLQCQGACRAWVHFKCLDYTPGKIEDIRAGLIKVMCPCPNCEAKEPKEVLTNQLFSCTNSLCPVNLSLSSEAGCPTKNYYPIPSFDYDSDSCPDCILPKYPPIAYRPSTPRSGNSSVICCSFESPSCISPSQQECKRRSCSSNCSSNHRVDGCIPTIVANESRSYSNYQNNLEHSDKQLNTHPVSSDLKVSCGDREGKKICDQEPLSHRVRPFYTTERPRSSWRRELIVIVNK